MSKPQWLKKRAYPGRKKARSIKAVHDGLTFDSQVEGRYYLHLKQLHKDGVVQSFEMQKTYMLQEAYEINGTKRRAIRFTPDFIVTYANGETVAIDVKGTLKQVSRDFPLRKKLFEERYNMRVDVILWSARDGGWVESAVVISNERKRNRARKKALEQYEASKRLL